MAQLPEKATHQQTRAFNLQLVLKAIYDHDRISRADIARLTGLTRATVSELVMDLLNQGLILEVGLGQSTGGKTPTLLSLAADSKHLIAIDLANDGRDRNMYAGRLVYSQLIDHLPMHTFRRCVQRYRGNHKVKSFTCLDQYLCMAFAQLTYRESLRDIEACLRSQHNKLYHMGIRGKVSRNTLANANKARDWRIYADFAQSLISVARQLYIDDDFGVEFDQTVYALDSTTIDLSLSVFPWARFRQTKAAIKLHTLLDLRGNIPTFIHISDGKLHDVNVLDELIPEPASFYVMDRGYLDFARLYTISQCAAFFVIRAKSNFQFRRIYSHPIDKDTGLKCD